MLFRSIAETLAELAVHIETLPRRRIVEAALKNSKSILVEDLNTGIDLINEYAPEHLIIATENANAAADEIINAGSVFIGNYSCESAGDYASGTNHTLPTSGFARAFSGVSVDSFTKKITFQKLTRKGIQNLGPTTEIMARAEGLNAHERAVSIRLAEIGGSDGIGS